MKFIVCVILTALLAFVSGLYLPWWGIALAGFAVAVLIYQTPRKAFLSGFTGLFLLWAIMASVIDASNQHIISKRIAALLPLGGSSLFLILLTALIGAIVGGLGALSGSYLRRIK